MAMKTGTTSLLKKLLMFLIILGCIDSLYILLTKYQCSACESVHNSIWGRPFGIPVAAFGFCAYLALLILAGRGNKKLALMLATAGLFISAGLVYIQFMVLKSLCIYCLLSASLMLIIWIILVAAREDWPQPGKVLLTGSAALAMIIFVTVNLPAVQNTAWEPVPLAAQNQLGTLFPGSSPAEKATASEKKTVRPINAKAAEIGEEQEQVSNAPRQEDSTEAATESNPGEDAALHYENGDAASEPGASDTLVFYRSDGSPVSLDASRDSMLFFSAHCHSCSIALAQVVKMPVEERPILIDTCIKTENRAEEIQAVADKLSSLSLDPADVLYDFDHLQPVSTIPGLLGPVNASAWTR